MSTKRKNQHSDYIIDPSLPGGNRLFVLSSEDETQQTTIVCKMFWEFTRFNRKSWFEVKV